jgi:hypothetical protein
MPLDDFRRQIAPSSKIDLDLISHCSDRYRVSLIAATLRWLSYTERRAVLVVSRDGYILWARSSTPALKTGAYYRTSAGLIAIPVASLAAQRSTGESRATKDHGAGVWFPEPLTEMTVLSEQYDFAISLLLLSNDPPPLRSDCAGSADSRAHNPKTIKSLPGRPRSADRTRSPAAVSRKREYFKYRPETIGYFAPEVAKFRAWRPSAESQKPAIGGRLAPWRGDRHGTQRASWLRSWCSVAGGLTAMIMLPLLRVFHPPGVALAMCPALLHCGAWFAILVVLPFTLAAVISCAVLSRLVSSWPRYPAPF